jgi:hypothetical protein
MTTGRTRAVIGIGRAYWGRLGRRGPTLVDYAFEHPN